MVERNAVVIDFTDQILLGSTYFTLGESCRTLLVFPLPYTMLGTHLAHLERHELDHGHTTLYG